MKIPDQYSAKFTRINAPQGKQWKRIIDIAVGDTHTLLLVHRQPKEELGIGGGQEKKEEKEEEIEKTSIISFGSNYWGELGIEKENVHEVFEPKFVAVQRLFDRIYAGGNSSAAITTDFLLMMWGYIPDWISN